MTLLHAGEVRSDVPTVQRLLAAQLPHLAGRPVRQVRSAGTVNAVLRVGEQAVRAGCPRLAVWAEGLERELRRLPVLAPACRCRCPSRWPAGARGRASHCRGRSTGGSWASRTTTSSLDGPAATRTWERAVQAPPVGGGGDAAVWVHADLLRPDLSVGVGDPAADVIAAWSVLGTRGCAVFRDALDVDELADAR